MGSSIVILDPGAGTTEGAGMSCRLFGGLAGKVVGFVDNTKPNFDHLADDMADVLLREHRAAGIVKHRKRSPSSGAGAATLDDLSARCDLVIAGSGD